jgi:hypothetical protein
MNQTNRSLTLTSYRHPTAKQRSRSAGQLASIPDTAERLVLAKGRYIGEGFND